MVGSIPNDIFQFSTLAAHTAGFNSGQPRTADLTSHGTDGIGIYEDGNLMILLDGQAYAVRKEGTAVPAPLQERLPFAMVTVFQPTHRIQLSALTLDDLEELMSSTELGPARGVNTLMPFKITTIFTSMSLEQGGHHTNIGGTVFGFIVPKWMREISGPRIHAHFLDEEESKGGRVESFEVDGGVTLGFAKCGRFHLGFPQVPEWEDVRLSRN